MAFLQFPQFSYPILSNAQRPILQRLVAHHIEHRPSCRARHRVPSERAEKLHPVRKRPGDLFCGDHRRQWERVPNRLPKHHNVRNHGLRLKSPEVRSESAKSDLHFISNANPSSSAYPAIHLREIIWRKHNLSCDARQSFCDKCRTLVPFPSRALQNFADRRGVLRARLRITTPVQAAIIVRNRRHMHPRLSPASARPTELVRPDIDPGGGMAVVGMLEDDYVFTPGVRAS